MIGFLRKHCGKRTKCWLLAFSPNFSLTVIEILQDSISYLLKLKALAEDGIKVAKIMEFVHEVV